MQAVSWKSGQLMACEYSEATQLSLLLCSLYALRDGYASTGWKLVEPEEAAAELMDDNLFVFVGDKLMCLSESRPWFSAENVITEEFVDEGIPLDTVVDVLKAVCERAGCNRFTVGTRAAANQRHAGLAKLYQRQGLSVSTVELVGELHGKQKDS